MSDGHSANEPAAPDPEFAGGNPLTEEALDQQIDDSFPASDPPSHTPTTGQSGPRVEPELEPTGRRTPFLAPIAAGGLALMTVALSVWRWRRHRNQ
ncbi:MAG: hypothetical protein ABI939_07865 [Anaerolineaceae bacterium]